MVRGLALRCLCSLRVEKLVEYIVEPIKRGLVREVVVSVVLFRDPGQFRATPPRMCAKRRS